MDNKGATLIGMQMKRIRTEHGWSQQKVCDEWPRAEGSTVAAIDRTVYEINEFYKVWKYDRDTEEPVTKGYAR